MSVDSINSMRVGGQRKKKQGRSERYEKGLSDYAVHKTCIPEDPKLSGILRRDFEVEKGFSLTQVFLFKV